MEHAEARALIVADNARLSQAAHLLDDLPHIKTVIVAEGEANSDPDLPDEVSLHTMDAVRTMGRDTTTDRAAAADELCAKISPDDLATLIYTSGTTGMPKGVMLSHENISSNAATALNEIPDLKQAAGGETVISFLPMTHIFARALQYGFMWIGASVHFTSPDNLVQALPVVQPTAFASVPRVLEKVYAGIQKKIMDMEGVQHQIGSWALGLAQNYDMTTAPSFAESLQLKLADRLVFTKWRDALGGRVKYIVVGGAALQPNLANLMAAAGVTILQGYGLTETSPVISFNRPERNMPGTVGEPMPGVEVRIADDNEILTRGPHVMQGYYKAPEKTNAVLTDDGWFHTGDIGKFDDKGNLMITDRKKSLFKLSTGKYVIPQPIENKLGSEALIDKAVVIGNGRKYCSALIFPNEDQVRAVARRSGLDEEAPLPDLLEDETIYQAIADLVQQANKGMDHWSTVKRFALIPDELTPESGLLTPTLKVKRPVVHDTYASDIDALYDAESGTVTRTSRDTVLVTL
jgi:long-chain acyl-CoA synthetase